MTFRLADSIPQALWDEWTLARDLWLKRFPKPWTDAQTADYEGRFLRLLEDRLDEGHGACILREPAISGLIADVFGKFDGDRYHLHSWVIMPNHVHALFTLAVGRALEQELKSWKGVSARRINGARMTSGALWQKDYHDRVVRSVEHFWRCARYVRRNPDHAKLRPGEFMLYEDAVVLRTLGELGNGP